MQHNCQRHPQSPYFKVCVQQECQNRGLICHDCQSEHPYHKLLTLNDFLNAQSHALQLVEDHAHLQQAVLAQLTDLKNQVVAEINSLQVRLQEVFRDEQQIRKVLVQDFEKRQTLIDQLTSPQNLTSLQLQQKCVELLHRSQVQPQLGGSRYEQLSSQVRGTQREIVRLLQQINYSKAVSNSSYLEQQGEFKKSASEVVVKQSKTPERLMLSKVKNEQSVVSESFNDQSVTSIKQKPQQVKAVQENRMTFQLEQSPVKEAVGSDRKKIFETPSGRKLEQRDLSPIGAFSRRKQEQSQQNSNYFTQPPQSQKSITVVPTKKESLEGIKNVHANESQLLSSHIQAQEQQIQRQKQQIHQYSSQFLKGQPSQDLNASYLSNRSVTPPPVKRATQQNRFRNQKVLSWRAHDKGVRDLLLMPNDKLVTCANDVRIWDCKTGQLKMTLEGHTKPVLCLAYHYGKKMLISGSADRTIRLWQVQKVWTCALVMQGHNDRVRCLCFITHQLIASGSDDTTIKIWDLEQGGICSFTLEHNNDRINVLKCHNAMLLAACQADIVFWDSITFKKTLDKQAHANQIVSLMLAPSGQEGILISGSKDLLVKVWEYPTMNLFFQVKEDYTPISLDLQGNFVLVGMCGYESEGKISIWELGENMLKIQEIIENGSGANKAIFDQNGQVICGYENKKVEIFNLQ